ncbi:MAG: hypothetical protein R2710_11470 [Acidimicrobiales bacterium]
MLKRFGVLGQPAELDRVMADGDGVDVEVDGGAELVAEVPGMAVGGLHADAGVVQMSAQWARRKSICAS